MLSLQLINKRSVFVINKGFILGSVNVGQGVSVKALSSLILSELLLNNNSGRMQHDKHLSLSYLASLILITHYFQNMRHV